MADLLTVHGLALVLSVGSAVYFARGRAWVSSLGFSIFLIFMVPLPQSWVTPFIARLQTFVSLAVIEILRGFSVSVYREGNVMYLPSGESLFVAEACSGITSIWTLVPLAVFLAYFTERGLSRRLILAAAVIPLAMLGNLLRVILTILAAIYVGVNSATGDAVHTWAVIGTYVLGCLALLAIGSLMKHLFPVR
jgi:exosortase